MFHYSVRCSKKKQENWVNWMKCKTQFFWWPLLSFSNGDTKLLRVFIVICDWFLFFYLLLLLLTFIQLKKKSLGRAIVILNLCWLKFVMRIFECLIMLKKIRKNNYFEKLKILKFFDFLTLNLKIFKSKKIYFWNFFKK